MGRSMHVARVLCLQVVTHQREQRQEEHDPDADILTFDVRRFSQVLQEGVQVANRVFVFLG